MGSSCSKCCQKNESKKSENSVQKPTSPPPQTAQTNTQVNGQNTSQTLFKVEEDSTPDESKKLIEEERMKKELEQAVKGGESAYGRVKSAQKAKRKGLPSNNSEGVADKKTKELNAVKEFFAKRQGIRYQLTESIGSGNYAEVYKAWYSERSRFVAIKAIDLTKDNENYRENFLKTEMQIITRLKHQHIVKHYEMAQAKNKVYMIMEYCANGSVTDWLRDKGAFSEATAWELDRRIMDGLHYMHSMAIAHRDLKLENILITDKMYPKISDFSYSVVVDEKECQSTTFCGSLPYFAPEILQRKPHNPLPSDIWAIGVCFYIMVCDGLPFKIGDDKQMLNRQLERDWEFKKRVQNKLSNEFKQIIHKMLEPDVSKRATSQQLINDQWFKSPPKPLEA